MRIRTGCDLVYVKKFEDSAGIEGFLAKVFTEHELSQDASPQTLAGFFAAKEAVIKALELPAGSWHSIEVTNNANGRPKVRLSGAVEDIASQDISISHDGEYVMATTVFILES